MKVVRVFPRRTRATPIDEMAFVGEPTMFVPPCDEVHVSVLFSWDMKEAERLAREWERVAPVKIGGPACGTRGGDFEPGMYLGKGYTITSRGCPNKCWFCSVWKRDGGIRELQIKDGFNILDDNLLACSEQHIRSVFEMLGRQKERAQFTGGVEAERLKDWHVDLFHKVKPAQVFFAFDEEKDYEPLAEAIGKMKKAGFNRHKLRCYVLAGFPNDIMDKAKSRLESVVKLGAFPMIMVWRDEKGMRDQSWMKFQKLWSRPAAIYGMTKAVI